tara:strand:- start:119 stop:955 length:837 start_codon:yes stop_codon:yes gene_type:complete
MIIWIASYPKSGNTFIRSFLSAYYYTNNGKFDFNLLKYIEQFPDRQFFEDFITDKEEASKLWVPMQKKLTSSNKAKFLKTHSAYGSYNNNAFTTDEVTIGGVYMVRDPRNIVSSLMNHFSFDEKEALEMLLDENRGIKSDDNNFATYSFLSTWANHVNSWSNIKNFRTMFIKYEDLENYSEKILLNLIKFINDLLKNNNGIDFVKFKRALETTQFDYLKERENTEGFSEAIFSKKDEKKISFFNLGFRNNWKDNLKKSTIELIEKRFEKEMRRIGYIK